MRANHDIAINNMLKTDEEFVHCIISIDYSYFFPLKFIWEL